MVRRLFLGIPLLAFWCACLLGIGTLFASRVDAGAFVPVRWAALAAQVTGLTQLTGAGSATDDDLIIYDTSAGAIKRIARSELASVVGGGITNYGYAKKTTDQTSIGTSATKLTFGEVIDVGGNYASDTFTAPRTKNVIFGVNLSVSSSAAGGNPYCRLFIYKNGSAATSEEHHIRCDDAFGEGYPSVQWMLSLTAGDTVDIYIQFPSGSTNSVYGLTASGTSNLWWMEIP